MYTAHPRAKADAKLSAVSSVPSFNGGGGGEAQYNTAGCSPLMQPVDAGCSLQYTLFLPVPSPLRLRPKAMRDG